MSSVDGDFQELVYARIQAMPDGTNISIGDIGTMSKTEVLKHVKSGDEVGQKMIEIERAFFEALKDGSLYDYAD